MKLIWLSFTYFLICLPLSFPLMGENIDEDADPIVVRLATESKLMPLYLAGILNDQASFPDSYLKQLEQILHFDLNHNGATYTVKKTATQDQLASSKNIEFLGDPNQWKQFNVFYVIKGKVQGQHLSAFMLSVNNQNLKTTEPILLSGDLNQDRRLVHRLADTIHKALFGTDGIASTRIIYTMKNSSEPGKWVSEVWESDYDGGNSHPLTHQQHYCVTPSYIPPKPGYNTGGFMYVSYQLGQPKIYVASTRDGIGHRLTYMRGNQLTPAISLQRDKVAFISDITGNPDLFLQPFNPELGAIGKPQQIFSARQATQGSPTFSPDGNKIAFVSNKDGSPRIYVMDIPAAGASLKDIQVTLITKLNRENTAPCWSPDGSKIAYCARTNGERQIWVYDFITNQEKQITQGQGNKENPSWAPNSLHLVFNSSDADSCELYLMNLNQSEVKQISSGPGEKRFPNWEPRVKN